MDEAALSGFRVVELGSSVAVSYCAKLMADLGAEVIKVEPPAGDPLRTPVGAGGSGGDSPLLLYLNTSKRDVVLDLEREEDVRQLRSLLSRSDVLLDDSFPDRLEHQQLGWEQLHRDLPELIYTSVTAYGRTGPRAGQSGDDLTLTHGGGLGNLLPARVKVGCVDINPATVTKLADRGTFQTIGLVTDVEPFLRVLVDDLGKG